MLRHRQFGTLPPHGLHLGKDNLLHRLLGGNPRPACQSEAVADVDAHFQTEGIGLRKGVVDQLPETGRELLGGFAAQLRQRSGCLLRAANGHEIAAAQSHVLHGLQVGTDARLGDGSVHPVPEGPRLCCVGRGDTYREEGDKN